jgi:hypothetical protein
MSNLDDPLKSLSEFRDGLVRDIVYVDVHTIEQYKFLRGVIEGVDKSIKILQDMRKKQLSIGDDS